MPVVFDPGSRTTGQGAQTYAITGPGWEGTLPEGVTEVKVPTSSIWILARTYSTGTPEDYKAVWALQDQFKLYPLSAWGKDYTPPAGKVDPSVDMKRSVRASVNALDAEGFFQWMNDLMVDNPPAPEDAPIEADLYVLVAAFQRLLRETGADTAVAMPRERLPITHFVERIFDRLLQAGGSVGFLALIGERPDRTYVIGDTPRDILCAQAIGARAIAVASGTYSAEALERHRPWWVLESLPEPATFLERLDGIAA